MRGLGLGLTLGLSLGLTALLKGAPVPLVSVLGTCSALTSNTYPADSVNWFDAARHSQVVFYAHLLFPQQDDDAPPPYQGAWHPPRVLSPTAQALVSKDEHFAEADWLDPQGQRIAYYSLTFPARIRSDHIELQGRRYIPHTLAMAIGTRDLRADAGQSRLPSQVGQYTVRLKLDGRSTGVAFFRMLRGQVGTAIPSPTVQPQAVTAPVQAR